MFHSRQARPHRVQDVTWARARAWAGRGHGSQRGASWADSDVELNVRVPSSPPQPRIFVRSADPLSLVACRCSSDSGAHPCSQDT